MAWLASCIMKLSPSHGSEKVAVLQVLQIEQLAWMQATDGPILLDPSLIGRLVLHGMLRPTPSQHLSLPPGVAATAHAPGEFHPEASGHVPVACTHNELDHESQPDLATALSGGTNED